jgi:hypothetical protein
VPISRRVAVHGRCLLLCPAQPSPDRVPSLRAREGIPLPYNSVGIPDAVLRSDQEDCRPILSLRSRIASDPPDAHFWLLASLYSEFCTSSSVGDPDFRLLVRFTNTSMFDQALAYFGDNSHVEC